MKISPQVVDETDIRLKADAYTELLNPRHADLLKKTAALANEIKAHYHSVNFEELAMELSMLSLAIPISPKITGAILVMVNPLYSYSTPKIVENAQRLCRLCQFLEPNFDLSRIIIKVPSTWEGMQACRKLKSLGIKTLATTLFSLEQAVLAAEAGCIYISPFLNELKATFDPSPIFDIVVQAQRYYEQHSCSTRVKACAAVNVEQILKLAGVHAFTAPADQLRELSAMDEPAAKVAQRSVFRTEMAAEHTNGDTNGDAAAITNGDANGVTNGNTNGNTNGVTDGASKGTMEKLSFIDDESKFRLAFARADEGRAQLKTAQALNLFGEYQVKAEALMRDNDMTKIG
ncbi:MAG: hypothetical protein LQ345_002804 [Seirophora villosa]|nr:MAG: hypothetical protein LQ345_002804 [Seirophora villosa]